ncbi:Uncharacterised protein [Moraxella lacunata]|uniref:Uncharacterized protein n=1 Tax=Moraxella lacunata TaxID=477 RepID=A0A378TPL9_MORLA|nr:hypothetical protein [Moraxella lacunata]STZ62726.1 Uncharacterised protein [Moraxella lacunata]
MNKSRIFILLISLIFVAMAWFSVYIVYYFQAQKIMKEVNLNNFDDRCYGMSTLEFRWSEKIKKEHLFFSCHLTFYGSNFYSLVFFYSPKEKKVVDYLMINNFYQEDIFDADYMKLCFTWKDKKDELRVMHEQCEVVLEDSYFFQEQYKLQFILI